MKAIVQYQYGSPDRLLLADVDPPEPADDELLVRINAASVNAYDWHVMRGEPYVARLSVGLRRPRNRVRGRDFAGRIEAVGAKVTRFHPGDAVFGDLGDANGAFAEYARVPEARAERKPANLSYEEAAAVPLAAATALTCLRDGGGVNAGQRVLINGASGGVGTFAVQIACSLGADVTGVCSTRNVELVGSLGASRVVDHSRADFVSGSDEYHVVLDLVGNRSLTDLRRVLSSRGTLVLSGGGVSGDGGLIGPLALMLRARSLSPFVGQRLVSPIARPNAGDLRVLRELLESGEIRPIVERTYALRDVPAAIRHIEVEHARAKIAITV